MSNPVGFSQDGFDWEHYARVRPQYPPSLWTRILAYHREHNGQREAAHDIGAGYGVVAKNFLLPNFSHVFVSDPVAHNLNTARAYLRSESEAGGHVSFAQHGGEDPWLPAASVDLITAFECIHWMDVDAAVANMAAALKPGGTLAILLYHPEPYVRRNERVGRAWHRIWELYGEKLRREPNWGFLEKVVRQSSEGLDGYVPLPSELFEAGAQRVRFNAELLPEAPHPGPEHPFHFPGLGACGGVVPDIVREGDERISVVDEDWVQSADLEWFKGVMQGLQPNLSEEVTGGEFAEIEEALREEGGKTEVFWAVDVVLATRK